MLSQLERTKQSLVVWAVRCSSAARTGRLLARTDIVEYYLSERAQDEDVD
jgi:hypothetical protein